ncbi:MAG: amidohydrolase family protein [Clostridia bacterium]|jgi:predicted TIM-barrel fold metal-dependent hydrolase|nr:amidohydrolase family protein [Clostridia bacterium]MCI2000792.1 amidohydrolase family protein [Clostridia bacterium]MCI2015416.1 amidohydrolase family protein [Clostridia bacterium]
MKKIDAHCHVGEFGGWADVRINIEELIKQMDEYEIVKTVLCSVDHLTNEDVLDAYKKYPDRIIPTVFANPIDAKKSLDMAEHYLKDENFKGIKLHPLQHAYVADEEIVDPFMDLAEKYNVPVFIHSGHPPYSLPWSIALLAERHPNVKTVMIHMGHGHGVYIDAALKMAKRFSNIYLEMSGMPMGSKIKEAYEKVGKDRIMFGTDVPFHHPTVEMQKVITSGLDEKAQHDVFYNNAAKLLGL